MTAYLDILDFLSLLLRAASFSAFTLCGGGVLFLIFMGKRLPASGYLAARKWTFGFSLTLATIELLRVTLNSVVLCGTTGASLSSLPGANYFQAGVLATATALVIAILMRKEAPGVNTLAPAFAVLVSSAVMTSHAAARLENAGWLSAMTALHLAGSALWMGGLPFLILTTRGVTDEAGVGIVRRFSRMAIAGVAVLAVSGLALSWSYIESWPALYGTNYGYMVCTKVVLFLLALVMGATNNRLIRTLPERTFGLLKRLRPLSEAEIGIGFTVILAAASLTSQAPAVDLRSDRLTLGEIADRFRPEPPRLVSPPVASLSPATPLPGVGGPLAKTDQQFVATAPTAFSNQANDIAWSEYNHHWAGIIVMAVGLLALLSRLFPSSWARYWPLMFVALSAFIILRADPENWPLGPRGFWESFLVAEVAQHRIYALLVVMFAAFELGVQLKWFKSPYPAMVFPLICAAGGALLLTHNHSLGNVKEGLLAEMSHTPIAVAGVSAGWARWLELRLPGAPSFIGWVWPNFLVIAGLVLVLYREA